jgi:hypothetical protein
MNASRKSPCNSNQQPLKPGRDPLLVLRVNLSYDLNKLSKQDLLYDGPVQQHIVEMNVYSDDSAWTIVDRIFKQYQTEKNHMRFAQSHEERAKKSQLASLIEQQINGYVNQVENEKKRIQAAYEKIKF